MASPRRLRMGKGTIALIASCVALLLLVPIAWLLLPSTMHQNADAAHAEVSSQVDAVVATIPVDLILSDEQSAVDVECPTDEGVRAVKLRRVLAVADEFDVRTWAMELREEFRAADGWHVRTQTLGPAYIVSVRGGQLDLVSVRAESADEGTELTMTSWSSCTAG